MYTYTAVVTSWWGDGTSTPAVQIPIRVPVVNEANSRLGAGWTVAGVHRLNIQSDGVLLLDGAGSVKWFANLGCTASECRYRSPAGDVSTLVRVLPNDYYIQSYVDGGVTHYYGSGLVAMHRDRFGNQVSFGYDGGAWGSLTIIQDPVGLQTTLTYHPGGNLASVRGPVRPGKRGYLQRDRPLTDSPARCPRGASCRGVLGPPGHRLDRRPWGALGRGVRRRRESGADGDSRPYGRRRDGPRNHHH